MGKKKRVVQKTISPRGDILAAIELLFELTGDAVIRDGDVIRLLHGLNVMLDESLVGSVLDEMYKSGEIFRATVKGNYCYSKRSMKGLSKDEIERHLVSRPS